uniref:glucuronosyltransferase n=1 Tax=Meloidogyne javanica TaxID=6303 RepID=A0A915M8L2_MELJA
MVNLIWLATFFFASALLLEFGVDSMKSQLEPGESSKSSKWLNFKKQGPKKKILLLVDKFLSHYYFAYFVVVKYDSEEIKPKPLEGVHFIEITYQDNPLYDGGLIKMPPAPNWQPKEKFDETNFFKFIGFYMFSFHKAIIDNPSVEINGENVQIFDWLKQKVKENFFDLGMAEYSVMTGAFPLFEQIERFHAEPGQGLKDNDLQIPGPVANNSNAKQYKESIDKFLTFYKEREKSYFNLLLAEGRITEKECKNMLKTSSEIPKIGDLLRKSRYYLINVHPIGQYSDTKMSKRIVNIGGIENEMEEFIRKNKEENVPESSNQLGGYFPRNEKEENWIYGADCVVLLSLGTGVNFDGFTEEHYDTLTRTLKKSDCNHLIRVTDNFPLNKQFENEAPSSGNKILFYNGMIKQREILEKAKVRLFVTHGGQNSFNEVLRAGIPIIVLPFFGDQPFNATLAEYLGIGISIKIEDFLTKFEDTFNIIMNEGTYKENALEIKNAIKKGPEYGQIAIFLGTVEKAIKEKIYFNKSPFPKMSKVVKVKYLKLDNLSTIVKNFLKSIEGSSGQ